MSFRIKLLASHAVVALVVGAVALLVIERAVSQRMEALVDRQLEAQAEAVARWLERAGHPNRLAGRLAGVVGARVTIASASGAVVGESHPGHDRPGADTPEVEAARAGAVGRATRYSAADAEHVRYVAVPAPNDAIVRLGLPIGEIDDTKAELRRQLGVGAIAGLLVALALAALVAAALTRRLRAASELARRIGAGDYAVSPGPDASDEVGLLSRTLVAAASELEATEARRREFLANVAHEIRTPVTSIRGYAETLANADVDAETQREFVTTIHRNAVRIGQLVDDILELEALQAGQGRPLDRQRVALARVVELALDTLHARSAELGAELGVDVASDVAVRGDLDAIERILLNLIDNALRHGGDGVTISIAARRRGDRAVLTVRDDGPGIPPEHTGRIFERFYRGTPGRDRDAGGSGLGLAIAHELAQAMGGGLALEAGAGRGAAFTLELPASRSLS